MGKERVHHSCACESLGVHRRLDCNVSRLVRSFAAQELASWVEQNGTVLFAGEDGSGLSPAALSELESQDQPEASRAYWDTLQVGYLDWRTGEGHAR